MILVSLSIRFHIYTSSLEKFAGLRVQKEFHFKGIIVLTLKKYLHNLCSWWDRKPKQDTLENIPLEVILKFDEWDWEDACDDFVCFEEYFYHISFLALCPHLALDFITVIC